jgi:hypothetical protein
MPAGVSDSDRNEAVAALVDEAVERRMNTKTLRRRARRMLDVVDRLYADQHEAHVLEEREGQAAHTAWFSMGDNADGTWSGRFLIPELHAHLLQTVLEHLCSPRRLSPNAAGESVVDPTVSAATGNFSGLSRNDSLGQAFMELCEHLPTDGLAQHGRVGVTVVAHIDHRHLLDGLAAAHADKRHRRQRQRGSSTRVRSRHPAGGVRRSVGPLGLRPRVSVAQQGPADRVVRELRHVCCRRLCAPVRVDRDPPFRGLGQRRAHRPGQRPAAVRLAPPAGARRTLRPEADDLGRGQVPSTALGRPPSRGRRPPRDPV